MRRGNDNHDDDVEEEGGGERRTIHGKNGTVVERTEGRGEWRGGSGEWRSREGGLKASSLHFGSEHRRANDVLIILGGAVFRAEQKLRTVKSDVQWELIGDEVVKGYILYVYVYVRTKVEFNRGIEVHYLTELRDIIIALPDVRYLIYLRERPCVWILEITFNIELLL